MDYDELSFTIKQKDIKHRKSWGDVKPETKIHKTKKDKRVKNNLKRQIDEALYGEEDNEY